MFISFQRSLKGALLGSAVLLSACDQQSYPTEPLASAAADRHRVIASDSAADVLAQGLARALESPGLRRQLLEDLRDSPFEGHRLHLKSYLQGARGRAIATEAARGVGRSMPEFLAALRSLPEMEIGLPIRLDRVLWEGRDDLVVVATTRTREELKSLATVRGYRPGGEAVEFSPYNPPMGATLTIWPAEIAFPSDSEAVRGKAPKQNRSTVSTPALEEEVMMRALDSEATGAVVADAQTSATTMSPGYQLGSQYSYSSCTDPYGTSIDTDLDGIGQDCEWKLAHQFMPYLQMSPYDDTRARTTYWSANKGRYSNTVKIFYALGYYRDGGTNRVGAFGHDGDSEFIAVEAQDLYNTGHWRVTRVLLSAHWGSWFDATGWSGANSFSYPETYHGRPLVWVAEEKHANWDSRSDCDAGAAWQDTCDRNSIREMAWTQATHNLGNSARGGYRQLIQCVTAPGRSGTECFWQEYSFGWYAKYFTGWIPGSTATTIPYGNSLYTFGF